ncbi:PTS sugar transporter subunit IIA [Oceanobacillus profundus]|uniref:PTS sugar transporter subunit IIA n=1 Tax=Oceanobacillus profundus TaxID=372463 RepID=UPI003635492E
MTELILNNKLSTRDYTEVIKTLGRQMVDAGYAKETYIQAVLDREKTLPTGLKAGITNVAIPHTDITHVNKSAVAIATLNEPVKFHLMEDPSKEVDVDIVFLLAVSQPEEQTELLRNLMAIFQDKELLLKIKNAENKDSLHEILKLATKLV